MESIGVLAMAIPGGMLIGAILGATIVTILNPQLLRAFRLAERAPPVGHGAPLPFLGSFDSA